MKQPLISSNWSDHNWWPEVCRSQSPLLHSWSQSWCLHGSGSVFMETLLFGIFGATASMSINHIRTIDYKNWANKQFKKCVVKCGSNAPPILVKTSLKWYLNLTGITQRWECRVILRKSLCTPRTRVTVHSAWNMVMLSPDIKPSRPIPHYQQWFLGLHRDIFHCNRRTLTRMLIESENKIWHVPVFLLFHFSLHFLDFF